MMKIFSTVAIAFLYGGIFLLVFGQADGADVVISSSGQASTPSFNLTVMSAGAISAEEINALRIPAASTAGTNITYLMAASITGQYHVLKELLRHPSIGVNIADEEGLTALMHACDQGHLQLVEALLRDNRVDVRIVDKADRTALHHAARRGHVKVARAMLIDERVEVNGKDPKYHHETPSPSPIHVAIEHQRDAVIQLLLDCPLLDVNRRSKDGTPLELAVAKGFLQITKLILDHPSSSKINMATDVLHHAIAAGNREMVKLLLATPSVDVNTEFRVYNSVYYYDSHSPLSFAAAKDSREIVQWLMDDKRVDVNKCCAQECVTPLMRAVMAHSKEFVKSLLQHSGIDVNKRDHCGDTALAYARSESMAQLLIAHGIKHDRRYYHPSQPDKPARLLSKWSESRCYRLERWYLPADREVVLVDLETIGLSTIEEVNQPIHYRLASDTGNSTGSTEPLPYLSIAVTHGHTAAVKRLLAYPGIDVNIKDKTWQTPYMLAAAHGHADTLAALLADSRVHVNPLILQSTLLVEAARNGHVEIVRMLIATKQLRGCRVKDKEGRWYEYELRQCERDNYPIVAAAAAHGRDQVLSALLSSTLRIDVNAVDEKEHDGKSVLQLASENGHVECVRRLLQVNGIIVDMVDKNNRSALLSAVHNGHVGVVAALLEHERTNVNKADNEPFGHTTLHVAVQKGQCELTQVLLTHSKLNVNAVDKWNRTALFHAINYVSPNCSLVDLLLAVDHIDVNIADKWLWTPLHAAVDKGNSSIVQALLAFPNMEVNAQDSNGCTPLFLAALDGNTEIVQLLLADDRVDVNLAEHNDGGMTPLMVARDHGHAQVVEALLAHPALLKDKMDLNGGTVMK